MYNVHQISAYPISGSNLMPLSNVAKNYGVYELSTNNRRMSYYFLRDTSIRVSDHEAKSLKDCIYNVISKECAPEGVTLEGAVSASSGWPKEEARKRIQSELTLSLKSTQKGVQLTIKCALGDAQCSLVLDANMFSKEKIHVVSADFKYKEYNLSPLFSFLFRAIRKITSVYREPSYYLEEILLVPFADATVNGAGPHYSTTMCQERGSRALFMTDRGDYHYRYVICLGYSS